MTRTNDEPVIESTFERFVYEASINVQNRLKRLVNRSHTNYVVVSPRIYKLLQSIRNRPKYRRYVKTTTLNRLRNRRRKLK